MRTLHAHALTFVWFGVHFCLQACKNQPYDFVPMQDRMCRCLGLLQLWEVVGKVFAVCDVGQGNLAISKCNMGTAICHHSEIIY